MSYAIVALASFAFGLFIGCLCAASAEIRKEEQRCTALEHRLDKISKKLGISSGEWQ